MRAEWRMQERSSTRTASPSRGLGITDFRPSRGTERTISYVGRGPGFRRLRLCRQGHARRSRTRHASHRRCAHFAGHGLSGGRLEWSHVPGRLARGSDPGARRRRECREGHERRCCSRIPNSNRGLHRLDPGGPAGGLVALGTSFYVPWMDSRDEPYPYRWNIWGAQVAEDGTVSAEHVVSGQVSKQFDAAVAWNGSLYLVAWTDFRVRPRRGPLRRQGDR